MTTDEICTDCAVRNRSLCGTLADPALEMLHSLGRRKRLAPGERLGWAGGENGVCGNVLSGVLRLTASTRDGYEQIVGLLYPADFVGSPYADASDFAVAALTEAELCLFPRHPFEKFMNENKSMERNLLQRTFAALDEARERMLMLSRQSALQKVAAFLLDMASRAEATACRAMAGGPTTFDLPLTRGQIADVLGLTIETVSRQMTRLKSEGIIALPSVRGVTIRDHDALRARAQPA